MEMEGYKMKIDINLEEVDKIAAQSLLDHYEFTLNDTVRYEIDPDGSWLHDDDYLYNKKLLKALRRVLKHYGKDVDNYKKELEL